MRIGDSRTINTKFHRGVVPSLEILIDRKLLCLVYILHTTEMLLQKLFNKLDGPTMSNNLV